MIAARRRPWLIIRNVDRSFLNIAAPMKAIEPNPIPESSSYIPHPKAKPRRRSNVANAVPGSTSKLTGSSVVKPSHESTDLSVPDLLRSKKIMANSLSKAGISLDQPVVNKITMRAYTASKRSENDAKPAVRGSKESSTSSADLMVPELMNDASSLPLRPVVKSRPANPHSSHQDKRHIGSMERLVPSTKSGGVPNPSIAYMQASYSPLQPSLQSQHLLVVIDLNGTLLYRPSRSQATRYVIRPFANEFLQYCIETFKVVIWSSAKPANVSAMCQTLVTGGLREKVVAIWGRDKFGLSPSDYNARVQCYKRLTLLWQDQAIARSHPAYQWGGFWDQTNTVLIDDSIEKAKSEPFNLLRIPEYFGDRDEAGCILPQVHDYLNFLAMHANVSASIRAKPFSAVPY